MIYSCRRCPAKNQCRQHWQIAKARFDSRINHINPKRVCSRLGFCNNPSLCDRMGGFQDICEESIEFKKPEVVKIHPIDDSNSTCILCEYLMNILSNYIDRHSTEEDIKHSFRNICKRIPSVLQNQCQNYIYNYDSSIIATLLRNFDLLTICHKLNLCTDRMNVNITCLTKPNALTCGICNYVSTYLHFALQRDSCEKSYHHALLTVCSHLSDQQHSVCQTIVYLFAPHIKQLELGPGNNFCKQLSVCQTRMIELKLAVPFKIQDATSETDLNKPLLFDRATSRDKTTESTTLENSNATPKCTICLYIISYMDAILKNNKSQDAVEEVLEKVCKTLPSKTFSRNRSFKI